VQFDRKWIEAHIPHQGRMCLLDQVELWNKNEIVCKASSHRLPGNPLRADGILGICNGIEYAAQAMAVHGALLAGDDETPAVGFLTSARDVQWQRTRLDDITSDLTIRAERISGNDINILYSFALLVEGATLLTGRASVMLNAGNL
jgi:predicted hotdog family 3-hydroxylacyl-ACP dehydratase